VVPRLRRLRSQDPGNARRPYPFRRIRPDLAADPANLQSLCAACHNAKTNRTDRGFGGPHGRPSMR